MPQGKFVSEYDEDYFENGEATGKSLYTDYRWMPELTIPFAHELIRYVENNSPPNPANHRTDLVLPSDAILDFGCAKGFLVQALRLMGYNAYGYDISDYAICHGTDIARMYCSTAWPSGKFDLIIAKDVLEHVGERELECSIVPSLVRSMTSYGRMLVVVPVASVSSIASGYPDWEIPEMAKDRTHRTCWPKSAWGRLFDGAGLNVLESGWTTGPLFKPRWVAQYPEGHAVFLLRKETR